MSDYRTNKKKHRLCGAYNALQSLMLLKKVAAPGSPESQESQNPTVLFNFSIFHSEIFVFSFIISESVVRVFWFDMTE